MAKILVTGGTGLIGNALVPLLLKSGHEVVLLSRNPSNNKVPTYQWDIDSMTIDHKAFTGIDSIIHLAGAGIADKPWTKARKQEIIDSRVKSAELLKNTCEELGLKLKSFISASAIGWYPLIISDKEFTEEDDPGKGYLSEVCKLWEESADSFDGVAEHIAKVRIGLVLCKQGGALPQMSLPVKLYVGSPIGNGKQAMPWIHVKDISRVFIHILENKLSGVYNGVGPENATNEEFMQTIADVLDRPMILPKVPEFIIKLLFGGKADLITKGVKVSSKKLKASDFTYNYPTLNTALTDIYFG